MKSGTTVIIADPPEKQQVIALWSLWRLEIGTPSSFQSGKNPSHFGPAHLGLRQREEVGLCHVLHAGEGHWPLLKPPWIPWVFRTQRICLKKPGVTAQKNIRNGLLNIIFPVRIPRNLGSTRHAMHKPKFPNQILHASFVFHTPVR